MQQWSRHVAETLRRAFAEFLKTPTIVIVGFLLLAFAMHAADIASSASNDAFVRLFSDAQGARAFLGVIAGSIITVTSITFSLLLIAVQQGAAALTSLVFDQFLRRRANQFYFGFFIGLALYSLVGLMTINPSRQPVYTVLAAGLMTIVALYMLIVLIYTTVDQMRPVVIIKSIHDHTLRARERQRDLLRNTRRSSRLQGAASACVAADDSGFMTSLDVGSIAQALADAGGEGEVVVLPSIGDYVAFGDPVAELRMAQGHDISSLEATVRKAVRLEQQRDLDTDPAFGIEQLAMIGWTSISTAKSNPNPGLLVIWNLRDVLARWLQTDAAFTAEDHAAAPPPASIVYADTVSEHLMKAFESLAVVASESMQYQCVAAISQTFAGLFHRLSPTQRRQAEALALRSLSGLGDHILTSELDRSLSALAEALDEAGRTQSAAAIRVAQRQLGASVGRLNSRATRVEAGYEA